MNSSVAVFWGAVFFVSSLEMFFFCVARLSHIVCERVNLSKSQRSGKCFYQPYVYIMLMTAISEHKKFP